MNDNKRVNSNAKIEQVVLERVLMYLSKSVSDSSIVLHEPEVRIRLLANVADQFVVTLRGWMLGNKFPDREEWDSFAYPDGWWETLKSEHAPKWFLAKCPVKMKKFSYKTAHFRYRICPHWAEDFNDPYGKSMHLAYIANRPDLQRRRSPYE